jgi:hypothetical protein
MHNTAIKRIFSVAAAILVLSGFCSGITSKITHHSSSGDYLAGEVENVIVSSDGMLKLSLASETIGTKFSDVWSINSIVEIAGELFLGTSPNGGIYRFSMGKLEKIYPEEVEDSNSVSVSDDVNDPNVVVEDEHLTNEHIFAMARDVSGRLIAGISGSKCELIRWQSGEMRTIYEPADANYIFAIEVGKDGDIYLGTGPEGKIYRVKSRGGAGEVIYDSDDKNILSLSWSADGVLYAGSDERGLVYAIDVKSKDVKVLYDSDKPEITALVAGADGYLYAAGTSAAIKEAEKEFALKSRSPGKPEGAASGGKSMGQNKGIQLKIANGAKSKEAKPDMAGRGGEGKAGAASSVYRINEKGFVTEVFIESAVFLSMAEHDGRILVGSGNQGRLFSVEAAAERQAVVYDDKASSQVTAIAKGEEGVYLGFANPAKLMQIKSSYSVKGEFRSSLIDAGQPGRWGKIQVEGDIPPECSILFSARSGNVGDVNDKTFSAWTPLVKLTGPAEVGCPVGRYCQYKLVFVSKDGKSSPVVREVAVASTVENLKPRIRSIVVERVAKKAGFFKVSCEAKDENEDTLEYKIDFRKAGRSGWIEMKDELSKNAYEWDSRTVEDGRYEIRMSANDRKSNNAADALSASRVSETVIVDNTAAEVQKLKSDFKGSCGNVKIVFSVTISDKLSSIKSVEYTIDSNEDWMGSVPVDDVYDTTEEDFRLAGEGLSAGAHVLAIKITDAADNVGYRSFEFTVPEN